MDNFEAARTGSVHQLKTLFEQGNDFSELTMNGWSPLHYAIAYDKFDNAEFLLNSGVDPDIGMDHFCGITPLMLAACLGKMEYVVTLFNHGADIGFTNQQGKSALTNAVLSGDNQCIHFLIKNGANVCGTLLYIITIKKQDKYVRMFVDALRDRSYYFFMAAMLGNVNAVRIFLELGTDVNSIHYDKPIIYHVLEVLSADGYDHDIAKIAELLILNGAKTEDLGDVFSTKCLEHMYPVVISREDFPLDMWSSVPKCDCISSAFDAVVARNKGEAKFVFERLSEGIQKQILTALSCISRTDIPADVHRQIIVNMFS